MFDRNVAWVQRPLRSILETAPITQTEFGGISGRTVESIEGGPPWYIVARFRDASRILH